MAYARKRTKTTKKRSRKTGGYGRKAFLPRGGKRSKRRRSTKSGKRVPSRRVRSGKRSGVRVTMVGEGIMVRRRRKTF